MIGVRHNIHVAWFMAMVLVMALAACGEHGVTRTEIERYPIAFASIKADDEVVTRAASTPLARDFIVYGYKNVGGVEQTVFNGYNVYYSLGLDNTSEDNTNGYYYVNSNQTVKYWDLSASEYHFWGVCKDSQYQIDFSGEKNKIVTIKDMTLRAGAPDPEDVLYSELYDRNPVSVEVVKLTFKHPYAKVRIQFYASDPINDEKDNVNITNISFGPDPAAASPYINKVYGKGDVVVTYPLTNAGCTGTQVETVSVSNLDQPQDALLFGNVTLTKNLGTSSNTAVTAPIDESEGLRLGNMPGVSLKAPATRAGEIDGVKYFYYPLPMGDKNPAFIMKANIDDDVNAEPKTAVVPANFMQWKPNFLYTYIFKITGSSGKKIEFYDLKIDPWKYGGSQDEEWKNW